MRKPSNTSNQSSRSYIEMGDFSPVESKMEQGKVGLPFGGMHNDTVSCLTWRDISCTIGEKCLLSEINGEAHAGELVAIMGPSGSGKTMLLNTLAHRALPPKSKSSGTILLNDAQASIDDIRHTSSYVEQVDHLIGSITTVETLTFAAKLSAKKSRNKREIRDRVDTIINAFGLRDHRNTLIGTPIQKGLSGGQKRRVSVASQLISGPKILFLDEPTSGLDSVAAYEIISYLKEVARVNRLIIIASIHTPSTKTFNLFDTVYLLARGKLCYGGPRNEIPSYFASINLPVPELTNPAEWILEMVDTDFSTCTAAREEDLRRLTYIQRTWVEYAARLPERTRYHGRKLVLPPPSKRSAFVQPFILLHRNFIKSYRDLTAYWLRVALYTALAILMGTTWLRLGYTQEDITARITALFFSGAFLSFMAVAYIPAYIEDQETFFKERANGLYGPLSFLIANTLIGLPYLIIIVTSFSVVAYWMIGLNPTAQSFFIFAGFLLLDLIAAESLVVLISSIIPNFIIALALVAFTNGLWMVVNGFLVPEPILNVFWKSWVTKINYQNWTFRAMMYNEFSNQVFTCGDDGGSCSFVSMDGGKTVKGEAVLNFYGYGRKDLGAQAGNILVIAFVYRLLAYLALRLRR